MLHMVTMALLGLLATELAGNFNSSIHKAPEFNFPLKAPFVYLCTNTPIKNFKHVKQERFHLRLLVAGLRYHHILWNKSDLET